MQKHKQVPGYVVEDVTSEQVAAMKMKITQQETELKISQRKQRKDSVEIEHLRTILDMRERNIFDLHQHMRNKFEAFLDRTRTAVRNNFVYYKLSYSTIGDRLDF